jgi:hypothetical protein
MSTNKTTVDEYAFIAVSQDNQKMILQVRGEMMAYDMKENGSEDLLDYLKDYEQIPEDMTCGFYVWNGECAVSYDANGNIDEGIYSGTLRRATVHEINDFIDFSKEMQGEN